MSDQYMLVIDIAITSKRLCTIYILLQQPKLEYTYVGLKWISEETSYRNKFYYMGKQRRYIPAFAYLLYYNVEYALKP